MGCDDVWDGYDVEQRQKQEDLLKKGYANGTTVTYTCVRCWTQVACSHTEGHSQWHEDQEQSSIS